MKINHIKYMQMALELAQQGEGHVSPNPLVGAVIVKDGEIIGKGFHEKYGQLHAERNALLNCTKDPKGAIMYVTLEPCCHYGKTPPCTEAIIEAGIKEVYVSILDPNPLVSGKGIKILEENNIKVNIGLLEEEAKEQNQIFLHFVNTKRPFVAMKYAMTMDGKIATAEGKSKWITCEKSREYVHHLRNKYKGIMVGIGTVMADDPMLNCRIENGVDPVRIICDSKLKISLHSKIVTSANQINTIIATSTSDEKKEKQLMESGCQVLKVKEVNQKVCLEDLMEKLANLKIDSILLEGGSQLNFSALQEKQVNKIYAFIGNKILGGENSKTPVAGSGFLEVENQVVMERQKITSFDQDILIESKVIYKCSQE